MALTKVRSGGIDYANSTLVDTSNSGSVTLNFNNHTNFVLTFTGNVTLANPTTENVGQTGIIVCIQDGTGSRTVEFSATDGFSINNSSSVPQPTTAANKVSIYTCLGITELSEWFISLSYIDD